MPNRFICDIFYEMRTCCKTLNFSYLEGLIEEAQTAANRMESALYDKKEHEKLLGEIKSLKEEKKSLIQEVEKLKKQK